MAPSMRAWPFHHGRKMGKRNHNQFIKRQKELERQRKAAEKMARRQGKGMRGEPAVETVGPQPVAAETEA